VQQANPLGAQTGSAGSGIIVIGRRLRGRRLSGVLPAFRFLFSAARGRPALSARGREPFSSAPSFRQLSGTRLGAVGRRPALRGRLDDSRRLARPAVLQCVAARWSVRTGLFWTLSLGSGTCQLPSRRACSVRLLACVISFFARTGRGPLSSPFADVVMMAGRGSSRRPRQVSSSGRSGGWHWRRELAARSGVAW